MIEFPGSAHRDHSLICNGHLWLDTHQLLPLHLQLSSWRYLSLHPCILCPLGSYLAIWTNSLLHPTSVPHFNLLANISDGRDCGCNYIWWVKILSLFHQKIDWPIAPVHIEDLTMLKGQYRCPHFRILVIGRANAGKTTILEKVCGVAKGTQPIIIYNKKGKLDEIPCTFSYSLPSRWRTGTLWNPFDTIHWGKSMVYIDVLSDHWLHSKMYVREVNMILSMRLHIKEVTLSSMTHEVLSPVQMRR